MITCFQALCNTLEATFSATPQNEEELDYASATLVLAGLLQLHARTPRYTSYSARLHSFPNHNSPEMTSSSPHQCSNGSDVLSRPQLPSPEELASAGFFHTGSGDETVCPACGLGLRDWQSTDQPETCHMAFSTAEIGLNSSGDGLTGLPTPALPCLYLAVRRLLASELPLARKSLVPSGHNRSVCSLPGVTSPPSINRSHSDDRFTEAKQTFASLADRLHAIARSMSAPPSPEGWPVENARALGHSNDMIVLALWRLQAEATGMGLACPPITALRLDPQATTDLLRTVLRLQEGFDPILNAFSDLTEQPDDDAAGLDEHMNQDEAAASDAEITAEDAETAALSQCQFQRTRAPQQPPPISSTPASPQSVDSNGVAVRRTMRLPRLYDFLCWWSNRCSVLGLK